MTTFNHRNCAPGGSGCKGKKGGRKNRERNFESTGGTTKRKKNVQEGSDRCHGSRGERPRTHLLDDYELELELT